MAWSTPRTWVASEYPTAAQLNANVRDNLNAAFPLGGVDGAWTTYTPTLTQSGAVTKTVTYARYTKVGRMVTAVVKLTVTGTGTGANAIVIGLPVTAAVASLIIGTGYVFDTSAALLYKGIVNMTTTSVVQMYYAADTTVSSLGAVGMTAALAAGDEVGFCATYEAAS